MKNKIISLSLLCFMVLAVMNIAEAQKLPILDNSPLDISYYPSRAAFRGFEENMNKRAKMEPVIRVIYSRPQKKGRDVFGELVKFDEVWRVGANESTEIMFYRDVEINGTTVAAGRYTLYVLPTAKEWTVYFNSDLDGWGGYKYNAENNVAEITVPVELTLTTVENFGIIFEKMNKGANMIMAWDDTAVFVPIQFSEDM